MLRPIILNNFLNEDECEILTNNIETNYRSYPGQAHDQFRFLNQYGNDSYHRFHKKSTIDLNEARSTMIGLLDRVLDVTKNAFGEPILNIDTFWLSKQNTGAVLPIHSDLCGGANWHFDYTALVYPAEPEIGGTLVFPHLDFEYKPKKGDLLLFSPQDERFDHGVLEIGSDRYNITIWMTKSPEFAFDYKI